MVGGARRENSFSGIGAEFNSNFNRRLLSLSLSACLFSFFFGEKIQNSYAQIHTHMMMIDRPVQHFTCVNFVGASSTNKFGTSHTCTKTLCCPQKQIDLNNIFKTYLTVHFIDIDCTQKKANVCVCGLRWTSAVCSLCVLCAAILSERRTGNVSAYTEFNVTEATLNMRTHDTFFFLIQISHTNLQEIFASFWSHIEKIVHLKNHSHLHEKQKFKPHF